MKYIYKGYIDIIISVKNRKGIKEACDVRLAKELKKTVTRIY